MVQIGFILLLAVPSTAYFTGFSILSNINEENENIHKKINIIDSAESLNDEKIFVLAHTSVSSDNDSEQNFIEEDNISFKNSTISGLK